MNNRRCVDVLNSIKSMLKSRIGYFNANEIDLQLMANDISKKTGVDVEIIDSILLEETIWMVEKGLAEEIK
jgi:hypothetical protein